MNNFISTPFVFGLLKPGYKAVCVEKPEREVFVNQNGVFYQIGELGDTIEFDPQEYIENTWQIQKKVGV